MNEEQATSPETGLETGSADPAGTSDRAGSAPTTHALAASQPEKTERVLSIRPTGAVAVVGLLIVALVLGGLAVAGIGSSRGIKIVLASSHSAAAVPNAEITVTGSGQVQGTPDTASFTIGVTTTAKSAVAALDQNNSQVTDLEHSLEVSGVPVKGIQTSSLDLSTNTNNNGDVTGFSADDELTVTMHDLSNLGQALDAAVHATGNGVSLGGISFSITNQSALLAAARSQAMLSSRTEADQLAAGAGLALGSVVKVTDQENAGQYLYFSNADTFAPTASSVPVQPGQQQISVQVTVVYQLKSS